MGSTDLENYLDVLERKLGALRGPTLLAQWRAQADGQELRQDLGPAHRAAGTSTGHAALATWLWPTRRFV